MKLGYSCLYCFKVCGDVLSLNFVRQVCFGGRFISCAPFLHVLDIFGVESGLSSLRAKNLQFRHEKTFRCDTVSFLAVNGIAELLRFITLKSLLLDVSNCLFSKNSLGPSLAKNSPDYPYFHGKCKPRQREKDDEVVKERISGISFSPSSQLRTVPFSLLIWFWYILPHPPLHCNCFFWYADLVRKRNLECEEYSLAQRRV